MVKIIEISREGSSPGKVVVGDILASWKENLPSGRRVVVITDPNVFGLYKDAIAPFEHIIIGTGEEQKTLETVGEIYLKLIEMGADRQTYIVGFGGGIVTDIAGFVASTYLRGVDFGFVATSLLAQVDASVGGKNGVNVGGFKNMAGVFRQPDFVLCPTEVLRTLPSREFRAGLAEMIKAGIIGDVVLFEILERNSPDKLLADRELLADIIVRSIELKARIVQADERERGERRKLNLGHTVGHAVEKLTRRFIHGEAVAIGLARIAEMAVEQGELDEATKNRIVGALELSGLPTEAHLPQSEIEKVIASDKKMENGALWLVVPRAIGEVVIKKINYLCEN